MKKILFTIALFTSFSSFSQYKPTLTGGVLDTNAIFHSYNIQLEPAKFDTTFGAVAVFTKTGYHAFKAIRVTLEPRNGGDISEALFGKIYAQKRNCKGWFEIDLTKFYIWAPENKFQQIEY